MDASFSAFERQFSSAAWPMLRWQFVETIIYHRGEQAITVVGADRGRPRATAVETRDPSQAALHTIPWTIELSQLADLGTPDTSPDWIEDAGGNRYLVLAPSGDQDWEYDSDDHSRVIINTYPDAEEPSDPEEEEGE
jgi:hypothetical protein